MLVTFLVVAFGLLASGFTNETPLAAEDEKSVAKTNNNELLAPGVSKVESLALQEEGHHLQGRRPRRRRRPLALRGRRNIAAISARPYNRSSATTTRPFTLYHNWHHTEATTSTRPQLDQMISHEVQSTLKVPI